MCNECLHSPCANTCPNNQNYDDERTVTCPLCGTEIPEEEMLYAVCDNCLMKNHSVWQAIAYGESERANISINGLYAKLLTPDQISEALKLAAANMIQAYPAMGGAAARDFLTDDPDAYAHWLIEQKNID